MEKEQIEDSKLYSIDFVADIFCVSKPTLRYWDVVGYFPAARTLGKHRRYLGATIKKKLQEMSAKKIV